MKRTLSLIMLFIVLMLCVCAPLSSCSSEEETVLYVYNWGEYIDPETLELFEKETGIKVIYDEFETNETMYPKVEAGTLLDIPQDWHLHHRRWLCHALYD